MQTFILEATSAIQIQALKNKTAIDISNHKVEKSSGKLKIEQQLLNKMKGQEAKEMSDLVIKSKNREVKLGIEGFKKG